MLEKYVRTNQKEFMYVEVPTDTKELIDYSKQAKLANDSITMFNHKLNTQHLTTSYLPKLFITGEFRKQYNLTPIELLFLLFIIDNSKDWCYYYQSFDFITSCKTTQKKVINCLVQKGLINVAVNPSTSGFTIDYTPTVDCYNKLFETIINQEATSDNTTIKNDVVRKQKQLYLEYLEKHFPNRYNIYHYITTSENDKIRSISSNPQYQEFNKIFGYIPLFIATEYNKMAVELDNSKKSPLLYFVQDIEGLYNELVLYAQMPKTATTARQHPTTAETRQEQQQEYFTEKEIETITPFVNPSLLLKFKNSISKMPKKDVWKWLAFKGNQNPECPMPKNIPR